MTTERQKAANRQNARSSTGPRSAEGKARSAMNATSHGLTGRPLVDDILNWYRVILGDAEAEEDELNSPRQKAAMNLAAAETRLALARQVQDEFLLGPDKDNPYEKGKAELGELIAEAMLNLDQVAEHDRELFRTAARIHRKSIERDQREREEQGRRLRRYFKDAEARREAPLRAWVEIEESEDGGRS